MLTWLYCSCIQPVISTLLCPPQRYQLAQRVLHHAPIHSWKDSSHLSHVIIRSYIVPLGLSELEKKASLFILPRHLRALLTSHWESQQPWQPVDQYGLVASEQVSPAYISEGLGSSVQRFVPCISLRVTRKSDEYIQMHVSLRSDRFSLLERQKLDNKWHRLRH